ncbi:phosphoglycerate mutase-like protein, partial [Fistulina hepatica ATCC 64428]
FTSTKEPFDPLHHSGSVSPYFDAPSMISPEVPDGCYVDQAAYIARHGSRYPEPDSYTGWEELYWKIQNTTFAATGPLKFLANWSPILDNTPHQPLYLTATGAGEAFDLGVQLRRGYGFTKGGDNFTVWSAGEQRVIDTSAYFTRGYLSDGNYLDDLSENRGQIVALPDSVNYTFANSLTPGSSCPPFTNTDTGSSSADTFRATYQSTVAARLNQYLDGLTLDASDIGVMGDLCGYEAAIDGDTRFCGVFEDDEWLDYEYAQDLNYYYGTGSGNAYSATVGYPWVKAIADLFEAGPNGSNTTVNGKTTTTPNLIMSFTHDNNLPPIISALGMWNATGLMSTSNRTEHEFRSSWLVAMRGYLALERMTCVTSGNYDNATTAVYVRVRTDHAPQALPGCSSGPGFSCPFEDWKNYIAERGEIAGDFVETCGLT